MFLAETPAPVSSIHVTPSSSSATVTWTLPASNPKFSSTTRIVIYLNNNEHASITPTTRHVTLGNLKPSTWYTVGIRTQDIYSQQSGMMTEDFTTKAGK